MKVEHVYGGSILLTPTTNGDFTGFNIVLPPFIQSDHLNLDLSKITPGNPASYAGWQNFYLVPFLLRTGGYQPYTGPDPVDGTSYVSINWGLTGPASALVNFTLVFTDPPVIVMPPGTGTWHELNSGS